LIIAQITDLHIGFQGKGNVCQNTPRFRTVIQSLNDMISKPDMVLLTGDLVESGKEEDYERLKVELEKLECPIYFGIGNHDNRESFIKNFPEARVNDGFIQYVIEDWPLRIIVLDTLKEGFHGGEFCERRQAWLEQTLAEKPDYPTLIAMHHPPIQTGIAWMTADEAPWVQRFRETLRKYDNIVHIVAGHIHRTIFQKIENTTISVCDAVASAVGLELAPIDPNSPDNRPLILDSNPGYSLHHWNGGMLTSHAAIASSASPLIRFDEEHTFILHETMNEKR